MPSRNSLILAAVALVCIIIIFFSLSLSSSSTSTSSTPEEDSSSPQSSKSSSSSSVLSEDAKRRTPSPSVVPISNNNNQKQKQKPDDDRHHQNHHNNGGGEDEPAETTTKEQQPKHEFLGVDENEIVPNAYDHGCGNMLPDVPLSPVEEELRRLLVMTTEILAEKKLIGWPADGTLLGLVRNGRVATDRDIDFQVHSTYQWCANHLHSLKSAFEARGAIRMFKVVYGKYRGKKIGRYAMVRMPPKYGDFGTGVDLNCVYTDGGPKSYTMHVHKGTIEPIPAQAFPLKFCLAYNRPIPCPRDPMAILGMFSPRYDGCMVYPHCTGDPLKHGKSKKCLTPHPPMPRQKFVDTVKKLDGCGWVSLKKHMDEEGSCSRMLEAGDAANKCEKMRGWDSPLCFLQSFTG